MEWYEIGIKIYDLILEEPITSLLFQLGTSGTYIEQEKDCFLVRGYITKEFLQKDISRKIKEAIKDIHSIFPDVKPAIFYIKKLEKDNWYDKWKEFFKPVYVTKELVILPAWLSTDIKARYIIKIDPGPAFGTGQHPTTQLCLKALDFLAHEITDEFNMLDIGTGTGILAIYGAMLGIKNIVAIDIDNVALRWAKHNIGLNNFSDRIILSSEPINKISGKFNLITANLLFEEIKGIISYVPHICKRFFIISGILKSEIEELKDLVKKYQFEIERILFQQDWACVISRRI